MSYFFIGEKGGGSFGENVKTMTWPTEGKLLSRFEDLKILGKQNYLIANVCHLGQRKLLLSEMIFYDKLPKQSTVIYAGSASGEHTPSMLELYPDFNFVMIDPNFHLMAYDYRYIYKRDIVAKEHLKFVKSDIRISKYSKLLKTKKDCKGKIHDALTEKAFGSLDDFTKFESRVYVIQDFMSTSLAKQLKKKFGKCYYVNDIRSALFGAASDADILYNSALAINTIKELSPIMTYYKMITPVWGNKSGLNVPKMKNHPEILAVKKYGFDFMKDYSEGKFKFLDGEIYLQPWAVNSSCETRILIKEFKPKYYPNYRAHFTYYNLYRANIFVPEYFSKVIGKGTNYDGCNDCNLEIKILLDHFKNIDEVVKFYYRINEVTFYDVNNPKCPHHGNRYKPKPFTIEWDENYVKKSVDITLTDSVLGGSNINWTATLSKKTIDASFSNIETYKYSSISKLKFLANIKKSKYQDLSVDEILKLNIENHRLYRYPDAKTPEEFYPDNDLNDRTNDVESVQYHMTTPKPVSPVLVGRIGKRLIKLDGVHRLVAAKIRGSFIRMFVVDI
jgi:hypothetical protein